VFFADPRPQVLQSALQEDVRQLEAACGQFAERAVSIAEKRAASKVRPLAFAIVSVLFSHLACPRR
jgi:hypothetical protein